MIFFTQKKTIAIKKKPKPKPKPLLDLLTPSYIRCMTSLIAAWNEATSPVLPCVII